MKIEIDIDLFAAILNHYNQLDTVRVAAELHRIAAEHNTARAQDKDAEVAKQ